MQVHHYAGNWPRRALRVILIGCGGNGSAILNILPDIHNALIAWGAPYGLAVQVMDHDVVSPTNCVRQPFGAADIGLNKAEVLVNRINLFHGFDWEAIPKAFDRFRNIKLDTGATGEEIDFVISCVDTKKARAEMHNAFFSTDGMWSRVRYWLDLGNGSDGGQFVLGQPRNMVNRIDSNRLPTVTELYPSIMDTSAGEDDMPSCSAAEALDRQEPGINKSLAAASLVLLCQLLRYHQVEYHGAFFNGKNGRQSALPINTEEWAKQRRRRRDRATRARANAV